MNLISAAGKLFAAVIGAAKWIDLRPGLEYVVVFSNNTNAAVAAGPFTFQGADPDPANDCLPLSSSWANLQTVPECDDLPSAVVADATVTFQGGAAIPAFSQCHVAVKCPKAFLRVTGTPGNLDIIGVVTRLRRWTK